MARITYYRGLPYKGGLPLVTPTSWWQCPYCRRGVGWLGNVLATIFGASFHGCDFSNVMHPQQAAHLHEIWDKEPEETVP